MSAPFITPRVRVVFIGVAALLVVQTIFMARFGEPYPAVVMPGFPGSAGYQDGRMELDRYEAVFVAGGKEFSFSPRVLLEEFPDSHHAVMARVALSPEIELPQSIRRGALADLQEALFPGFGPRNAFRGSPEYLHSLQDWLRRRANALLPGKTVDRVEIRWSHEKVRMIGDKLEIERQPSGALVVPLIGERS